MTRSCTRCLFVGLALTVVPVASAAPHAAERLPLVQMRLDFPSRDVVRVTLRAAPETPTGRLVAQRLTLGNVAVRVPGKPLLVARNGETFVTFSVPLADVPVGVLDLSIDAVEVRWFGLDRLGSPLVVVSGIIDPLDRTQLVLQEEQVRHYFASLGPVSVTPGLTRVGLRVLVSVYNPFRFDLVVTGMTYRLAVGAHELFADRHAGFRLRAGQPGDVLIDESVPITQAISAGLSLLRDQPIHMAGSLTLRTPSGERPFPLFLVGVQ